MSWFGDVGKFEGFNLKEMGRKIGKDPERLLMGSADPFSTKMWNGVTGSDHEPIVDQWGGASKDTYTKAENSGIDTGAGGTMHDIAKVIASVYAGRWAGGKAQAFRGGEAGGGGGMQGMQGMPMGGMQQPQQAQPQDDRAEELRRQQMMADMLREQQQRQQESQARSYL